MHRVLLRQLRKHGLAPDRPPTDPVIWASLVRQVHLTYENADQTRYLLEQSLAVSSREMEALYADLQRVSESRLAAERDNLRRLVSALGAGLVTLDAQGRVCTVNPEGLRLLRTEAEALVGATFFDVVTSTDDPEAFTEVFAEGAPCLAAVLSGGAGYRTDDGAFLRADGSLLPVSYTISSLPDTGAAPEEGPAAQARAVVVFIDLTQRHAAEQALRRTQSELESRVAERTAALEAANTRLRHELEERAEAERQIREQAHLLERARDAICVLDVEGRILSWNRSAERLYGWPAHEAIGQCACTLLRCSDAFAKAHAAVMQHLDWVGELEQFTRGGERLTVESRWTLVPEARNAAGSILMINTDVTEKRRLEAQFLRAQRMESIGTLAGGIAHDLNNTLGPIIMAVDLLQQRPSDLRTQRLIGQIGASANRGAELVRQVLSFARGVEGERVPVPLEALVDELVSMLRQTIAPAIRIEVAIEAGLWMVLGDMTQLHQVLLNLCVNACEAMPAGGLLRLHAANAVVSEPYAQANLEARPGRFVQLTLSDTGCGMPPEKTQKVFEPFYTTKEQGTGLGLATVLGIVRSHDGFINVYSEVGRGTQFQVFLPSAEAPAREQAPVRPASYAKGQGECVLVVDDDEVLRTMTRHVLTLNGYRVIMAENGAEGLACFEQHRSRIDLVLTDMMMPVMDGEALVKALRQQAPALPIIAASGLATNDRRLLDAGLVQVFLHKPYTGQRILEAMGEVLAARRTVRPGARPAGLPMATS